jgi:membrane-associated phospholipid phosphatase
VLVPVLAGEVIKWIVGRGRPFVGGEANAFNFAHFAGTEAYASFPSGHAVTSFALAFAVSAIWPRARAAMVVYAILIAISRLVLLAHHPSDVVAGALIGVVGAMFVRYWFAARRLGFAISRDGSIVPLAGPSLDRLKRVARRASSP